ncbi:trans-aconitate 2-methyltransferase [Marmoricola endophyticus]|uniref:Trans-aconitate 2-methyltransferase n=1 Tax=Marmoricola endophyticus TaxID=2040280 RepID=A0A917BQB9_9ACTN|nr:methyltransferase domain-containing protein [Marmoricola endophyticus]GGF52554.1 trans-aconitate 2-methyltransferase [Marmoricola endophyticus]
MAADWDPARYLTYADDRGRPFVEMLARVRASAPRAVVDLGCGPGNLTGLLAQRWPDADVTGIDSSPAMIEKARALGDGVRYEVGDVREWNPDDRVDVVVTNATLQWVPDHLDLVRGLVARVAPDGWFAMQVPGNFDEPSHTVRLELERERPYREHLRDLARPGSYDAPTYADAVRPLADVVDAWETTYLHVLDATTDPDPVFTWISATSARPALGALEPEPELRARFVAELKERLREAYPPAEGRVVMPFRRVFCVVGR